MNTDQSIPNPDYQALPKQDKLLVQVLRVGADGKFVHTTEEWPMSKYAPALIKQMFWNGEVRMK